MIDTILAPRTAKRRLKVLDPDIEFMLVEGRYVRPAIG